MVAMLTAWLLIVAAATSQSSDPQPKVPAALRAHLATEAFKAIATTKELPPALRSSLASLFKESTLEMADPGTPFQATDVPTAPPLPWRRMVTAGCSADHCLVYYEEGGFAHYHIIVVFKLDGTKARFEYGAAASPGLDGIDGVKAALAQGAVIGQLTYF